MSMRQWSGRFVSKASCLVSSKVRLVLFTLVVFDRISKQKADKTD